MRTLDTLIGLVRSPDSREHFKEAVRAYEAGAFRAAIVATWTAVAFDLFGKVRELADHGDKAAERLAKDLDKASLKQDIRILLQNEQDLLDKCEKEFEILSHRDAELLRRLKQDRNMCAHPAHAVAWESFIPTAEIARAHLAAAVDSTMKHEPRVGKALEEALRREVAQPSWIPEAQDRARYFKRAYVDKAREATKKNLFKFVIKSSFRLPPDVPNRDQLFTRYRQLASDLASINPGLYEEALRDQINKLSSHNALPDDELGRLISCFGHDPIFWDAWLEDYLPKLESYLQKADIKTLSQLGCLGLDAPDTYQTRQIRQILSQRRAGLSSEQLADAAKVKCTSVLYDLAVEKLCDSGSYADSNNLARVVYRHADRFSTVAHSETIAEAVRENSQVREAFALDQTLAAVFRAHATNPNIRGIWADAAKKMQTSDKKRPMYPELKKEYEETYA